MYHVSAQGIDECMINVHYYIYIHTHTIHNIYITECIVCVSGYDPLTFLSCPFPF